MNESNQSSENPNPVPNEPQPPPPSDPPNEGSSSRNKLAEIGRLIRGENPRPVGDPPPDDDDNGEPKEQDGAARRPSAKVKSLDDAAKALGISVEDLYALDVPLRNAKGEKIGKKLGELKDYFAEQDTHNLDRIAWDEERGKQQASITRERAELAEILAAVPQDKLNAAVIEGARKKVDARISIERRKTLEKIPAWEDDETRTKELTGIAEHLVDYGFPPSTLQGISDSRMIAYMRDNYLRMKRLNDALERVKPVRTATPKRSSAGNGAPQSVRPSTGARTQDVQVNAISKLLRG